MHFYSRGKLLLSGEYLVLKGATALAVPLTYGQDLKFSHLPDSKVLQWTSKENGKVWFRAQFEIPFFKVLESTDEGKANYLAKLLKKVVEQKSEVERIFSGAHIETNLDFHREWGFGSSSTLISNLARLAGIDAFKLNAAVSEGSGYDVVAAQKEGPFFFTRKAVGYSCQDTRIDPQVSKGLYFVYLGKKAKTSSNIQRFLSRKKSYRIEVNQISELSLHLGNANTLEDFGYYMKEHEQILSSVLKEPSLKESRFKDFSGEVKSLGAWGGDFAMLSWPDTNQELIEYLQGKALNTLFDYKDIAKEV